MIATEYYMLHTSYIFKNSDGKWEETHDNTVVYCADDTEAKIAGLILAFNNARHCEMNLSDIRTDPRVGCVKIGRFKPWAFNACRGFKSGFSIHSGLYEWKMDWCPYEEELKRLIDLALKENPSRDVSFARDFLNIEIKDAIELKKLIQKR